MLIMCILIYFQYILYIRLLIHFANTKLDLPFSYFRLFNFANEKLIRGINFPNTEDKHSLGYLLALLTSRGESNRLMNLLITNNSDAY